MNEETRTQLENTADSMTADKSIHNIWLCKEIIAPVLQRVIPEYSGYSVEQVIEMIDSDIRQSDTVSDSERPFAQDRGTEQYSVTEKLLRFDVHIKAKNPVLSSEKIQVMLHIDYEIQNVYNAAEIVKGVREPYDIEQRAMYYVARELSSQLRYVTENTCYNRLEKCYSIWVCTQGIPENDKNSVSVYNINKKDVFGSATDHKETYDLMSVIIIRLGDTVPQDTVLEYIDAVNCGDIDVVDQYIDTTPTPKIREELRTMKGFATMYMNKGFAKGEEQGFLKGEEQGFLKGEEQGLRKGGRQMLYELVAEGKLSSQDAAVKAGVSEERFLDDMALTGYKLP